MVDQAQRRCGVHACLTSFLSLGADHGGGPLARQAGATACCCSGEPCSDRPRLVAGQAVVARETTQGNSIPEPRMPDRFAHAFDPERLLRGCGLVDAQRQVVPLRGSHHAEAIHCRSSGVQGLAEWALQIGIHDHRTRLRRGRYSARAGRRDVGNLPMGLVGRLGVILGSLEGSAR